MGVTVFSGTDHFVSLCAARLAMLLSYIGFPVVASGQGGIIWSSSWTLDLIFTTTETATTTRRLQSAQASST